MAALLHARKLLGDRFVQAIVGLLGTEYEGVRLRLGRLRSGPPARPAAPKPAAAALGALRVVRGSLTRAAHAARDGASATLCGRGRSGYPWQGVRPFDPGAVTCQACLRAAGLSLGGFTPATDLVLVRSRRNDDVHAARRGRGITVCRRARSRTLKKGPEPAPFEGARVTCRDCRRWLRIPATP